MRERSEKLKGEEDEEEELRGWLNDNERFKPCRIALHNLKPALIMSTADGSECFTTVYDSTSDKSIAESICISGLLDSETQRLHHRALQLQRVKKIK